MAEDDIEVLFMKIEHRLIGAWAFAGTDEVKVKENVNLARQYLGVLKAKIRPEQPSQESPSRPIIRPRNPEEK